MNKDQERITKYWLEKKGQLKKKSEERKMGIIKNTVIQKPN